MDVIDPSIYAGAVFDPYRTRYIMEADPFDRSTGGPTVAPSKSPSRPPADIQPIAPTILPTAAPSSAPSARNENVMNNGGCAIGEHLYAVRMYDSFGDGWGETALKITEMDPMVDVYHEDLLSGDVIATDGDTVTISNIVQVNDPSVDETITENRDTVIFEGGLPSGWSGYSYVCLETTKCYHVSVEGGHWEGEITWEVQSVPISAFQSERDAPGAVVAVGAAPANCRFALPREVEDFVCPQTCIDSTESPTLATASDTFPPSDMPSSNTVPSDIPATFRPTSAPSFGYRTASGVPSDGPSLVPSDMPSMLPSDTPSLLPSQ